MLEDLLYHLKNWFVVPNGIHIGEYKIEGGVLTLPFLTNGQYFRVVGSALNDGLHKYGEGGLEDESFYGAVWALSIPRPVIKLAEDIAAWETKNGAVAAGPYESESYAGYSYKKATDSKTGGAVTWKSAFRDRCTPWRKI